MAAIDFPASPALNQVFTASTGSVYQWNGTVWVPVGVTGSLIAMADTPPGSPAVGQLWWNSTLGALFVWFNDGSSSQWVPATPVPSLAGILTLYSETVLAAPAQFIPVTFPVGAKRVELHFSANTTPQADTSIYITPMIGASPNGANVCYEVRAQMYATNTLSADFPGPTASWLLGGIWKQAGIIIFDDPAGGGGTFVGRGISVTAGTRYALHYGLESTVSTFTGYRLQVNSNNFAAGSWMRCYVVT